MTARTHDLAAFTALNLLYTQVLPPHFSFATLLVALGANFIGGLAPDLDNSSARLWKHVRGGTFFSKLLTPLLGGHRLISHSLLGMVIAGVIAQVVLRWMSNFLLVDMHLVWWAFLAGLASHLFMDALTKEGIPLFFPIPVLIGFPPFSRLRMRTGKLAEKVFIFPLLMVLNGYLFWRYYDAYLQLLQSFSP